MHQTKIVTAMSPCIARGLDKNQYDKEKQTRSSDSFHCMKSHVEPGSSIAGTAIVVNQTSFVWFPYIIKLKLCISVILLYDFSYVSFS